MENKRDLSISMTRANVLVLLIVLPVAVAQFVIFMLLQETDSFQLAFNPLFLMSAIVLGVLAHELIHALSWMMFGQKSLSAIKLGFQWKTFTPYAHLKEPVEVNAYRVGAFMPGLILGILPYILSIVLSDGSLFLFSLVQTAGASGDWLVLWLIRNVKRGTLVEDHPTKAGCYVLEP